MALKGYDIIKGTEIRGSRLRLPRAIAIHRTAQFDSDIKIKECRINSKGDEIIIMSFRALSIPDEPVFPILKEEDVAIKCSKEDLILPSVFALRKDFPIGLPHSNAMPYAHPVSLCVSDVPFSDYRLQFSAYDFLQSIRRWFDLNSIGELHEPDRPLEVFYGSHIVATIKNFQNCGSFGHFHTISKNTGILEYTERKSATHYILPFKADEILSNGMAEIPEIIGDLNRITVCKGNPLLNVIESLFYNHQALKIDLPLLLPVLISQKRAIGLDAESSELFFIVFKKKICDIALQAKKQSHDSFQKWLYSQQIDIVMTLPPVSRELNASSNGLGNLFKKVSFIGAGTLGGNIIDHFVRQGVSKKIVIIDDDSLLPHNIARHVLSPGYVMQSKAKALKDVYRSIEYQKVDSIDKNVLLFNNNDKQRAFENADLIIDASTSIAVERNLALDNSYGDARRSSVFLNPKGTELVLLYEDTERKYRLDLLEMTYYRMLIVDERLNDHLSISEKQRTNSFSCRAESSIIDYDNVGLLASIASQQLKKLYTSNDAKIAIWRVSADNSVVDYINIPLSDWQMFNIKGVKVYIINDVISTMKEQRLSSGALETGGVFFGCYDKDRQIIYVLHSHPAPTDSKHGPTSFVRGCDGLKEVQDSINLKTYYQVRYLGEWHSHPSGSNTPSTLDKKQFDEMSTDHLLQDIPFVQAIIGDNGVYVNALI